MQIALFADVHGNLPALELFIEQTKFADKYVCLGDVVNYGPWSNECVQLVSELKDILVIKGNHEEAFLQHRYDGSNKIARAFFDYCFPVFTEFKVVATYVNELQYKNYLLTHTLDNKIIFEDTDVHLTQDTILAHSHKQYDTTKSGYRLVNPGSVGQNRTYINVINYMVWNTENDSFDRKMIKYDSSIVIDEMRNRGYPAICVDYYQNKKTL